MKIAKVGSRKKRKQKKLKEKKSQVVTPLQGLKSNDFLKKAIELSLFYLINFTKKKRKKKTKKERKKKSLKKCHTYFQTIHPKTGFTSFWLRISHIFKVFETHSLSN